LILAPGQSFWDQAALHSFVWLRSIRLVNDHSGNSLRHAQKERENTWQSVQYIQKYGQVTGGK